MHSCEEEEEREREGIIMTSEESGRNEKQCPPLLLIQLDECMQTERLSLMHPLSCGTQTHQLSVGSRRRQAPTPSSPLNSHSRILTSVGKRGRGEEDFTRITRTAFAPALLSVPSLVSFL